MMRIKWKLYLGIVVSAIISMQCNYELYNFTYQGIVVDSSTNEPVENASLELMTTRQISIDESASSKFHLTTDSSGKFCVNIDHAYELRMFIHNSGYLTFQSTFGLGKKSLPDTIRLRPNLISSPPLAIVPRHLEFTPSTPYIRERSYYNRWPLNVHLGKNELWGYDFFSSRSTNNLNEADIWLEKDQLLTPKKNFIIKTSKMGGIYPVMKNEIDSSPYLEPNHAPENGYLKEYRMTGQEAAFFLICRDGKHIAKIIPGSDICEVTTLAEAGTFHESGIRFGYILVDGPNEQIALPYIENPHQPASPLSAISGRRDSTRIEPSKTEVKHSKQID